MKKILIASVISVMSYGMASAQMPTMNATDHVFGYHLRDVYKDMEAMKYDDSKLKNDMADLTNKVDSIKPYDDSKLKGDMNELSNKLDSINSRGDVLTDSIANITTDIANTSNRIDGMENTFNNSISSINNNMGNLKNDINSLVATTDKLNHHVNDLRGDLSKLKSDTHKGLAQANALSGLKYLGGKGLQLSLALGGYRGQSAIAYGMFYGVNDDLMLYAGGTDDSYNASINIRIGGK